MKTRIVLVIAISAVATLSFSFSGGSEVKPQVTEPVVKAQMEPLGGFVSEDKF